MMQKVLPLFLLLSQACATGTSIQDLAFLNGYWEIAQVTFADGQEKQYLPNTTIDHIALQGKKGIRKKVAAQWNGTFSTTADASHFEIIITEDAHTITYEKGSEQWEETLLQLTDSTFSVRDGQHTTYHYKRHRPITPMH